MKKLLKKIKKIVMVLLIFGILGGGWFYYNKYKTEKLRKLVEEEKRRQEELEKEKQRKLLEEKQKEFENLLTEMEKYFKAGDYIKVKEISEKALALAKQFNFSTDRINEIFHKIEINTYLSKLKKLERENEDIYKYFYVRIEVKKIPPVKEVLNLRNKILNKTYENEYKVKLILADKALDELKKGIEPSYNYFLSRKFYAEAKKLRETRNIRKEELENKVQSIQNELFFASKSLYKNTIPNSLY
ncbi:MAG TPA: hypothetical protein PKV21_06915 [bacterium]|nr:hypothetical protein [bacterium]HOM27220.1 hypothetical protein [bacterium]